MKSAWTKPQRLERAGTYSDPRYEWTRATRFSLVPGARWFHVLIEFDKPQTARAFAKRFPRPTDDSSAKATNLWVPSLYGNPPDGLAETRSCTAIARIEFLGTLYADLQGNGIRRVELGTPIASAENWSGTVKPVLSPQTLSAVSGKDTVVVGIIDDGLAIAHERFRIREKNQEKTRVECFWDQVEPNPNPLPNWDYGRELCKHDVGAVQGIDSLLQKCRHGGLLDEDEFYRETGLVDFRSPGHKPTARRSSHGTHVMDIACGEDPKKVKSNRPIVCVQLPLRTTEDTSGATLAPQVLDALWYIAARAGPLPLAVNLSYGLFAGPHDGTGLLETCIDDFIEKRSHVAPTAVVLPAGNSYLARCHARFKLTDTRTLHWRVLPDDRTPSILEIWLPDAQGQVAPKVKVRVVSPANDASGWLGEGENCAWGPAGTPLAWIAYLSPLETLSRSAIRIVLNPTATLDPAVQIAPSGIWRVEIRNDSGAPIDGIHAWIERDDAPHGYPVRGRQSRFEDPKYVRFDLSGHEREIDETTDENYVRRAGSLNGIATGKHAVVIGGCRRSDLAAAKYSSGGPVVARAGGPPPPRDGLDPDAMAVSEDAPACHGLLAAGARSGSVVAINGTSIAAPQITRELAGILHTGVIPRRYVKQLANTQEATMPRPVPPYKQKPSPERGGEGRIVVDPIVKIR